MSRVRAMKRWRVGTAPGGTLADHEAEVSHSLKQFTVAHRVGAINAVRHDRDRVATGCQAARWAVPSMPYAPATTSRSAVARSEASCPATCSP